MASYRERLTSSKTWKALTKFFRTRHAEEDEARLRQMPLLLEPNDTDTFLSNIPALIQQSMVPRTDDGVPRGGMQYVNVGVNTFNLAKQVERKLWNMRLPNSTGLTVGHCLASIMIEQMNLFYRQGATMDSERGSVVAPNLARIYLSLKSDEAASAEANHNSRGYVEKLATCGISSLEGLFADDKKWIPFLNSIIDQFFFGEGSYQVVILRCILAQEWAITNRESNYMHGNYSMPSYRVESAAQDTFNNIKCNTVTTAAVALQKWMDEYEQQTTQNTAAA